MAWWRGVVTEKQEVECIGIKDRNRSRNLKDDTRIYEYMGGRLFECQPLLDSSSTSVQMSLICFKINKVTNNGETMSW